MRKKIMTLMIGTLLLLTACGQTGSNSASTMLPVAAVQSAAQAIAPMEDKTQEDVDSLPAEEGVEEVKGADDKETRTPPRTRIHLLPRRRKLRLRPPVRDSPTRRSRLLHPNSR